MAKDKQTTFAWADPGELLAANSNGSVVFEAPEVSRIARGRAPRLPRVRMKRGAEPPSLGLPFGAHAEGDRLTCWSCGQDLDEVELVRPAPGTAVCPGCGARIPFAE